MKYLSFKLKEIVLYYFDYRVDYNDVNEGIQRGDKNIGDKIDSKYIKKKNYFILKTQEKIIFNHY